MSNNDLTRTDKPSESPSSQAGDLLPGFEAPPGAVSGQTAGIPAEEPESSASGDPFTPPPGASAPPLPGMLMPPETPPPVIHLKAEKKAPFELHPPAKKRAALAAQTVGPKKTLRFNATAALAVLSGVLGLGLIVSLAFLVRSPEAPTETIPNDIPLALLPDTADPTLWETVSTMSGKIDDTPLSFKRGLATDANGRTYRLMLDFCRNGSDIYAKVVGEKTYVVRVDSLGKITKSYPAPKNKRPLKEIFGE